MPCLWFDVDSILFWILGVLGLFAGFTYCCFDLSGWFVGLWFDWLHLLTYCWCFICLLVCNLFCVFCFAYLGLITCWITFVGGVLLVICVGFDCWGLVVDFLVFVLELVLAFVCLSVWVW